MRLDTRTALAGLGLMAGLAAPASADFTLTILHNNDGESSVLPTTDLNDPGFGEFSDAARFVTLVDQQKATSVNPIMLSSGDNYLAGPTFNASQAIVAGGGTYLDAILLDRIGYDALAIGNHEFDFGTQVFSDFIDDTTGSYPFLSSNLDFTNVPELQAQVTAGRIAPSTILNVNGEQVGIIGATTEGLASVTSPGATNINAVQPAVQAQVNTLTGMGVNKIILISHLQSILEEQMLANTVTGLDVIVAGGGDELLADPGTPLLPTTDPGDIFGDYPLVESNVPIVTTPGGYGYLGKLVVDFDDAGNLLSVNEADSGLIRVAEIDGIEPDQGVIDSVQQPVIDFLGDAKIIGTTEVTIEVARPRVRGEATNGGALITDAYLALAAEKVDDLGITVPVIAIQNGGGIRDDFGTTEFVYGQQITDQAINEILPFDNEVVIVESFTAERLLLLLEEAVDSVPNASGGFAQVGGFWFTFDPEADPDSRVVDVYLNDGTQLVDNGVAIDPSFEMALVTNSFSASQNGDGYPLNDLPRTTILETMDGINGYAGAVIKYIQEDLGGVVPADLYDPAVTSQRIQEVPEPASLVLLGLGGAMLVRRGA
ncbi:5'-nucleotidase C-terminal domain-containing protein [Mucisphaera calidilacus]|uniref:Trifunctional nucleotide phosphoesterase protein YfkN n=1 Tax=Mucisphaera calidilacus TaxID=2527982 RepID=A0A518BZI8_9BACT|nr:5'-nucleotidase C-terminal domain-containing protein [Mucisphaera calidilacus]QDU72397.1 Trifunctional nucleotide phosphoesterase protein YfkN precursor [Mucisphaera calidilacus]